MKRLLFLPLFLITVFSFAQDSEQIKKKIITHDWLSSQGVDPFSYLNEEDIVAIWDYSGLVSGQSNTYGEVNGSGHIVSWKSIAPGPLGFDLTPAAVGAGCVLTSDGVVFNGTTQLQNATKALYKFLHYNATSINDLKHTVHFLVKVEGANPGNVQMLLTTNRSSVSRTGYTVAYSDTPTDNAITVNLTRGGTPFLISRTVDVGFFVANQLQLVTVEVDCSSLRFGRLRVLHNNSIKVYTPPSSTAETPSNLMNNADSDVFSIGGTDAGASRFSGIIKQIVITRSVDPHSRYNFANAVIAQQGFTTTAAKLKELYVTDPVALGSYRFASMYLRNPINGLIIASSSEANTHYFDVNRKIVGRLSTDDGVSHGTTFDIYKPHDLIPRFDDALTYNIGDQVSYLQTVGAQTNYFAFTSLINGNTESPDTNPGDWNFDDETLGAHGHGGGFDSEGNCHFIVDVHNTIAESAGIHKVMHVFYPYLASGQFDQTPVVTEISPPADGLESSHTDSKLIQLDNGDLFMAIYRLNSGDLTSVKIYGLRGVATGGGNYTWSYNFIANTGSEGINESQFVSSGSTVICYSRREADVRGYRVFKSTDNGVNWSVIGNTTFDHTFTSGHPIRIEKFTLRGTEVWAAYFSARNEANPSYLAYYGKASDIIAQPITGWNLNTETEVFDFVTGTAQSSQGSGYGGFIHPHNDLRAICVAWGENINTRENTYGHYVDLRTDHEQTIITELGL